eukprot:jgi/Botrbrau1/7125/Bobra.0143s0005.1
MDFYDANAVDFDADDGAGQDERFASLRESIVFLIDAQPHMFEQCDVSGLQGISPKDTWFDVAVKIARETIKSHIIGSASDKMAVIFYGTRETHNKNAHEHVYTYQELDEPDAQRIRDLDSLVEDVGKFEEEIGSYKDGGLEHLRYGLWAAHTALSSPERAQKRIMLFTNDPNPGGEGKDARARREKVLTRVENIHEAHIALEFFPMVAQDTSLDSDFWKQVVEMSQEGRSDVSSPADLQSRLGDLVTVIRQRSYKKRAVATLRWRFPGGLEMAVGLYQLVVVARKGAGTYLEAQNNMPLKSEAAYICMDTGAPLTVIKKRIFPPPSKAYEHSRFPPILLDVEELRDLKAVQQPGLHLLGFKPLSSLKDWHQLRTASFLYPAERARPGSTTAFIALHEALMAKEAFALCALTRSRVAESRLVACLPQQELVDESGTQIEPPGFNIIYLPYSDDLREPETDTSFMGTAVQQQMTSR